MTIVHEIQVPFHRWSCGEQEGWHPGCAKERGDDEVAYCADAWGCMLIAEVHRVSIPGYEDRVFYTRQWRGPDGTEFGKRGLKCKGARAFARMLKGWRHPFYLDGVLVNSKEEL